MPPQNRAAAVTSLRAYGLSAGAQYALSAGGSSTRPNAERRWGGASNDTCGVVGWAQGGTKVADDNDAVLARCAECRVKDRACARPEGSGPPYCPTFGKRDTISAAIERYQRPEVRQFAHGASVQEAECYANRGTGGTVFAVKPRIQETVEFAHRMGYRRLGLAFCAGLRNEARVVAEILEAQGFEVVSAICKVGAVPKEALGIAENDKIRPGSFEPMCNPVAQAAILAEHKSEFNIVVGLCVGHDSLFFQSSEAPCTVLVTKDRVTGHNPLAAIALHDSYYSRLKEKGFGPT